MCKLDESDFVSYETGWLIENHLILSEFAFKKDIEDFSIIKKISNMIQTKDRLTHFFCLLFQISQLSTTVYGMSGKLIYLSCYIKKF